jgi:hypothetical protein
LEVLDRVGRGGGKEEFELGRMEEKGEDAPLKTRTGTLNRRTALRCALRFFRTPQGVIFCIECPSAVGRSRAP